MKECFNHLSCYAISDLPFAVYTRVGQSYLPFEICLVWLDFFFDEWAFLVWLNKWLDHSLEMIRVNCVFWIRETSVVDIALGFARLRQPSFIASISTKHKLALSSFYISSWKITLNGWSCISSRSMDSPPKTKAYGVSWVAVERGYIS